MKIRINAFILLIIALMSVHIVSANPVKISKEFEDRRNKYITGWVKKDNLGNIMQSFPIKALSIFRESEITKKKNKSKLDKANQLIIQSLNYFDSQPNSSDGGHNDLWVWHGWPTTLARIYVQYQAKTDLLYPSTQKRMLGKSNQSKSLKGYQAWICWKDNRKVGIKKYPEAFDDNRTENHRVQIISLALMIAQVFKGETCKAGVHGHIPMFDGTFEIDKPDDYYSYWRKQFFIWLDHTRSKEWQHIQYGIEEKDSRSYIATFIASIWQIRDAFQMAGDDIAARYAEMYLDLVLADYASEVVRGLYVGSANRYNKPISSAPMGDHALGVMNYLLFDAMPYDPGIGTNRDQWANWGMAAIIASDYTPLSKDFPLAIIDLAVNKPDSGYINTDAYAKGNQQIDVDRSLITSSYGMGFKLLGKVNQSTLKGKRLAGGIWVTKKGTGTKQINYAQMILSDTGGNIAAVVGNRVAIVEKIGAVEQIWYDKHWAFSMDGPWMFFASKSTHNGKKVYVAIRPAKGRSNAAGSVAGGKKRTLSHQTPVVWEVSDSDRHASLGAFKQDVQDNMFKDEAGWLTYKSTRWVELGYNKQDRINHQINGKTHAYTNREYRYVINNPFVQWEHARLAARIHKGKFKVEYDFDPNRDGKVDFNSMPIKKVGIDKSSDRPLAPTNLRIYEVEPQ